LQTSCSRTAGREGVSKETPMSHVPSPLQQDLCNKTVATIPLDNSFATEGLQGEKDFSKVFVAKVLLLRRWEMGPVSLLCNITGDVAPLICVT